MYITWQKRKTCYNRWYSNITTWRHNHDNYILAFVCTYNKNYTAIHSSPFLSLKKLILVIDMQWYLQISHILVVWHQIARHHMWYNTCQFVSLSLVELWLISPCIQLLCSNFKIFSKLSSLVSCSLLYAPTDMDMTQKMCPH